MREDPARGVPPSMTPSARPSVATEVPSDAETAPPPARAVRPSPEATETSVAPPGGPSIESRATDALLARGRDRRSGTLPPLRRENLGGILKLAAKLHDAGHLDEAARVYERVLDADDRSPEGLHLYGILRAQRGEHVAAAGLLEQAVRVRSGRDVVFALGQVYFELGRFEAAAAQFQRAFEFEPSDLDALRNLGHAWFNLDRFEEAANTYRRLIALRADDSNAWASLGFAYIHLDRVDDAREAFEAATKHDPQDEEAAHLYAALSGERTVGAPDSYVRGLFDRYAEGFDRHLLTKLQYRIPEHFRTVADGLLATPGATPSPPPWRIADLGCGTGLCGAAFADLARRIVGVDLSPRMLERCAQRRLYDELHEASINTWLAEGDEVFDLMLAGDVMIYVGQLESAMHDIRRRLVPGGMLILSTECCGGDEYEIRHSGRYAHSVPYLDRVATAAGLELVARQPTVVRVERERPLTGHVSVLRRPIASEAPASA